MNKIELPDFMKYKDKFTASEFVEKISRVAKRAGSKFVYAALILYYTLESDKVSIKDKAIIIGALGYLISPLDVMPDAIPIAGLSDDLAVLIYVLRKVWGEVSEATALGPARLLLHPSFFIPSLGYPSRQASRAASISVRLRF